MNLHAAYLTGRCRSGYDGTGALMHAIPSGGYFETALCGRKPGRLSSGWSEQNKSIEQVDCAKCLKKMNKMEVKA